MKRDNLKEARQEKGFTQANIAEILGISERQYRSLEAGTSNGTIPLWEQLKSILGGSIDYLLEREQKGA